MQQGRSGDAAQFLRRAVELQPNDWSIYSALGVAYDQLSDPLNAKLAYEHALALKPGEPAILNNYAMSRMLAGDTASARILMAQAQASGSTDPKIVRNLALLNSVAPAPAMPARPPVPALASTPPQPRAPVARNEFPPVTMPAHGVPTAITRGATRIVMQEVPFDPLAGPVGRAVHPSAKPAKPVKVARTPRAPQHLAVNTPKPNKPPQKAKPSAINHIPALRMTADASKP